MKRRVFPPRLNETVTVVCNTVIASLLRAAEPRVAGFGDFVGGWTGGCLSLGRSGLGWPVTQDKAGQARRRPSNPRPPSLTLCPLCPHSVPERVREASVHREQRVLSPRVSGQLQRAGQRHGLRGLQALLLRRRLRAHLPAQHLPLRGLALRGPRLLRQHPQRREQRLRGVRDPRRRVHAGVPLGVHPEWQSEVSGAAPHPHSHPYPRIPRNGKVGAPLVLSGWPWGG